MNLDELLALFPDDPEGNISAGDLRTAITELYRLASIIGQVFSYEWTTDSSPSVGHLSLDQPWLPSASKLLISETTGDGENLTFSLVDNAIEGRIGLSTSDGARLKADILGPSVDLGTYRELPIEVTEVEGTPPSMNERMTFTMLVMEP